MLAPFTAVPAAFVAAAPLRPPWYRAAPAALKRGVYVAEYYTNAVLGFDWATRENRPPICSLPDTFVVDVTADPLGNLVDPDGGSRTVTVYGGPKMCGPALGTFADAAGQPSDAATHDAAHDTIYVANLQAAGAAYGDVSVCSLASGCGATLTTTAIGGELFAVAEDKAGNLYATGYQTPSAGASFVWWKRGAGKARRIAAYANTSPGGLDVDGAGNILALDTFAGGSGALYVYSGCPNACTAHGPFALKGESVYGKVDARSKVFQAADFEYGQIDVYRYGGTSGITYEYSYGDGLSPSGLVEGIALEPAAAD